MDELVRRFDAVLLDFYGTVVHEDDAVIAEICEAVSRASPGAPPAGEIARVWWQTYSALVLRSHGSDFEPQRVLEHASLVQTLAEFGAACDAAPLSERMYVHWQQPPIFDDARAFLERVSVPVVVVSNIDRDDIEMAIDHHRLSFDAVLTSEDVRSYKPRPELFLAAVEAVGAPLDRVLVVGDSVTSDVAGGNALGIPVAWVNRRRRRLPSGMSVEYEVSELTHLLHAD
jgi:2-haloacid dehalogenase/putative hydrolase of the HAD superfamily